MNPRQSKSNTTMALVACIVLAMIIAAVALLVSSTSRGIPSDAYGVELENTSTTFYEGQ